MTQPEGLKDREQRAREWLIAQRPPLQSGSEWRSWSLGDAVAFAKSEVAALEAKLAEMERERDEAWGRADLYHGIVAAAIGWERASWRAKDGAHGPSLDLVNEVKNYLWMAAKGQPVTYYEDLKTAWGEAEKRTESAESSRDAALADAARLRERESRLCEIGLRMVSDLEGWLSEIPEEDRTTGGCIKTQSLIDEAGDAFSEPAPDSTDASDWLAKQLKAERERVIEITRRECPDCCEVIEQAIRALDGTPPRAAGEE